MSHHPAKMPTIVTGVKLEDLEGLNYTILIPYNGTDGQGGNPLDFNVNLWYEVSNAPATLHISKWPRLVHGVLIRDDKL